MDNGRVVPEVQGEGAREDFVSKYHRKMRESFFRSIGLQPNGIDTVSQVGLSDSRGEDRRQVRNGSRDVIPLFKVAMSEEAPERVAKVLRSGYIGQGPECDAFEKEFQALVGTSRPPLLVNSCTSAITLALDLCGVGPGDYVISTPMTCTATNTPIVNLGARILWADVDPNTGLLTYEGIKFALRHAHQNGYTEPKAIIAVDWGGAPCDYEALKSFGIPVIQDAAHRLFVSSTSQMGDYVCWSHQAIKFLTTGDGGSLLVPEDKYEEAKLLRWYGLDRESSADFRCSQDIKRAGWKFQSNDIAASIGRANIPLSGWNATVSYRNSLQMFEEGCGFYPQESDCWLHTLLVKDRPSFIQHMKERGIAASPVHRRNDAHTCFSAFKRPLPGVDEFSSQNVAIPNGWFLSQEDLQRVISAVQEWRRA